MKRLIALCSSLCLGLVILLTSCGSKNSLPNISGSLKVETFKTVIAVTADFVDSENHDLYNTNVKSYVSIHSTGEEVKELSRKDVAITTPSTPETNLTSSKLEFNNLTADTKYSLKLVISANGSQRTLATKEVTTLNNGESEDDPILIDNLDKLLGMNKTKDAYYKLTADIDCGGTLSSIFNSSNIFTGHLDGDNHKIYNFKIDSNQYAGLFGYMTGATVKNLILDEVSYDATRSNTYLGALVGYAKNCVIENVKIHNLKLSHSGQTTTFGYVGGFVGVAENSEISNCTIENLEIINPYARLKMYVGGFVGENKNSKITNCNVTGSITSTISYTSNSDGCLYVGGFVGVNDSNAGIHSCYAKVDITVKEPESTVTAEGKKTFHLYVGGFNGGNRKDASRLENCASVGDINVSAVYAAYAYVGGFAGIIDNLNVAIYKYCVYIPKDKGVSAKFAPTPTSEEGSTSEEEKKVTQEAYISLAIGKIGTKSSNQIHTIVYRDALTIENEHDKLVKTPYTVSQDLTGFADVIRGLISEA